jgi:hypothetical protein
MSGDRRNDDFRAVFVRLNSNQKAVGWVRRRTCLDGSHTTDLAYTGVNWPEGSAAEPLSAG